MPTKAEGLRRQIKLLTDERHTSPLQDHDEAARSIDHVIMMLEGQLKNELLDSFMNDDPSSEPAEPTGYLFIVNGTSVRVVFAGPGILPTTFDGVVRSRRQLNEQLQYLVSRDGAPGEWYAASQVKVL